MSVAEKGVSVEGSLSRRERDLRAKLRKNGWRKKRSGTVLP